MSDLMTDQERVVWFLREFENADDYQLEDGGCDIYGEDENGRELTCFVATQKICKQAADLIEQLQQRNADLEKQLNNVGAEIDKKLQDSSPEFREAIKHLPAKHWSKNDISACRMGWELCKQYMEKEEK